MTSRIEIMQMHRPSMHSFIIILLICALDALHLPIFYCMFAKPQYNEMFFNNDLQETAHIFVNLSQ